LVAHNDFFFLPRNGKRSISKPKTSMDTPVQRLIFRPNERAYNSVSFKVKMPKKASIIPKIRNKRPMGMRISISILIPPTRKLLLTLYLLLLLLQPLLPVFRTIQLPVRHKSWVSGSKQVHEVRQSFLIVL